MQNIKTTKQNDNFTLVTTHNRLRAIELLRAQLSASLCSDGYNIIDIALCGHMDATDQIRFLNDLINRGIFNFQQSLKANKNEETSIFRFDISHNNVYFLNNGCYELLCSNRKAGITNKTSAKDKKLKANYILMKREISIR